MSLIKHLISILRADWCFSFQPISRRCSSVLNIYSYCLTVSRPRSSHSQVFIKPDYISSLDCFGMWKPCLSAIFITQLCSFCWNIWTMTQYILLTSVNLRRGEIKKKKKHLCRLKRMTHTRRYSYANRNIYGSEISWFKLRSLLLECSGNLMQ